MDMQINDLFGRFTKVQNIKQHRGKILDRVLKNRIIGVLFILCLSFSAYAQDSPFDDCIELYMNGDAVKAIECLNNYIGKNPKHVEALNMRAYWYANMNEYKLALADIGNAIKYHDRKTETDKDELYRMRARFYMEIENYDDAFMDYAVALKINPKNTAILYDRANLYYNMENYSASDADWKQFVKIEKGNVNAQVGLARNMTARGQFDDAIKELDRLEKLDPRNPNIYRYRCTTYAQKKNYRKAIDDLINWCYYSDDVNSPQMVILLDYADYEFTYALAKVSEKIVTDKDDLAKWLYLRTNLYTEHEMYGKAVEDYNTYETLFQSPSLYIFYLRGGCYTEMGEYDRAIADFNEGIKLEENAHLYLSRANVMRLKGDFQSAIADFTKVIELDPMNSFAYYRRGWTKEFDKDFHGALEDYNTAIELNKEYAYAYIARGRLYFEDLNKPQFAEKDFQTVLSLENEILKGGNCRQYALFYLGKTDDAMAHQNAILDKYPTSGNYYDATCLYSLMNRQADAIKYLRIAFEKGYRDFVHMEHDTDLDNIRNTREYKELVEEWNRKAEELSVKTTQATDALPKPKQKYVVKTKELKSGVYEIPCTVNDLPLKFIFDTGASDITISSLDAAFMLKNNYLNEYDFRERKKYLTASGDIVEGTKVRLRKIKVGDLELNNIDASVVHKQNAPLLFGQSVLGQFVKITINNKNSEITFEQ